MNRLLHNFVQMLKKDRGAHFTYNIGVSFLRAGCALLAAAVTVLICSAMGIGKPLRYIEDTTATMLECWKYQNNMLDWLGPPFEKYVYGLTLTCEQLGEGNVLKVYVSKGTYKKYEAIEPGTQLPMKLYEADPLYGSYYLSQKNAFFAAMDMRRFDPYVNYGGSAAIWLLAASLPLILIGIHEERLAMKYPRSDVPFEISGAPVPVYDTGTDSHADPAPAIEDKAVQSERGASQ